ncbi:MAG TPA: hypothetical protein VMU84_21605, partial [Thermoanaerobaculia bacterium]|nr:hypothetical protein [Thermoanaerobaculia bacterium]
MNVVRDRAEARWLPSRHHYALFRLFASLRYRFAKPQPVRGLMLMIDRDQSTLENFTTGLWMLATLIAFLAAQVGFLIAIPLSLIVIQLPLHTLGPLIRRVAKVPGQQATSIATLTLYALAAAYYTQSPTWIRYIAWQFLGILALNAIVSCILKPRHCILLFALIAPIALVLLWPYSPLAAIGVLALSHALVLYP